MTLEHARALVAGMIGDTVWPSGDGDKLDDKELTIDGRFSLDQLEAICIVMRADSAGERHG